MSSSNTTVEDLHVMKRSGNLEPIAFDKILVRVKKIGSEANLTKIKYGSLVMKIIDQLYDGIESSKIDELTSEQCASMITVSPDYGILAAHVSVSNHHKNTENTFFDVCQKLYNFKDFHGQDSPIINDNIYKIVSENKDLLESYIDYSRDYLFDYFGFKTLERAYLLKCNKKTVERPQHMWMRVAISIHGINFDKVKETYDMLSQKYFTHATPTLFNAGTQRQQLSSCYLIGMESDSIEGIYNTLKDCANISKWAGGIGLHIHNVRASGSHIRGTNGTSNGIVPMLKVFNHTARYVDQGGGKRNGSFAVYIEPWHADIELFLDMRRNQGDEEMKARDLFYALWVPDLFMEKVKNNDDWALMCPHECPGLADCYGEEFKELYNKYVSEGKHRKLVSARELWLHIMDSQMETGTPYILFKDACNKKSNQKNLGTIKSSNLCTEIVEYSNSEETAVCNLASISLSSMVNRETKLFDYELLHKVTKIVANNLNNVIDINYYPTEKTKKSNFLHRPIGIGVQGLADAFILMGIPFCSDEAKSVNKLIFETIYHASLEMSNEIAISRYQEVKKKHYDIPVVDKSSYDMFNEYERETLWESMRQKKTTVGSYSTFEGSPTSTGILQFDLWGVTPSDRYDWESLKRSVIKYGIRNSLLVAPMPTASTAQILGNNECFEPLTSNIYSRRTLAGEFLVVNKYLQDDLTEINYWNDDVKNSIIENKGSIQHFKDIPTEIKDKYKIVWEMKMKDIVDMAADRGAFICQSQSLNLWVEEPTNSKLTSMHMYSWQKGLKTGIYYLRRKAKHQAQQFTIDPEQLKKQEKSQEEDEVCEMCSA
jgi:ribonucleoside-diphosphate reductase alpha subunit